MYGPTSGQLRLLAIGCQPDVKNHGFQYVDWQFDGADIIAVCRTAYEDGVGGARNCHDANFLTFHRWKNFRTLTMADGAREYREERNSP
jgi:hypothetical protein